MRFRLALLVFFLSAPLWGHTAKSKRQAKADPSYSSALQTADRFLHAWQTQDHEAGIMMMSDHARQLVSPEQVQQFFSPDANAAFEIEHGRRRKSGGYAFPVVLFGASPAHRVHFGEIVIVRSGKNDWAVERLP